MMGYWNGYGFDCGGFPFFSFIFWIILIVLAIMFVTGRRRSGFGSGHWPGHDRSIEILKERYARGEIDKEEFEAKKKDLSN